nr:lysine--tRNA ligase [Candidatus Sigynarchaeota archaeon]
SLDAAKKFPPNIPKSFKVHLGKPFSDIPCPVETCGCESYAHHWGNELVSTFAEFGLTPEIHWAHELYKTPGMKRQIKRALDSTVLIRQIVLRNILPTIDAAAQQAYIEQMKTWFPAMAICSKCGTTQYNDKSAGKIFANRIVEYDPDRGEIVYECPNPACKNKERVSIDDARLKLNWRVDWPAKWDLFKTTCEPAGKDHATKGGSYDTGLELCREVFGYEGPIKLPYEWLRLGDQDMSTSGGIVFNPREFLNIGGLPEAFRHVIVKTKPITHISMRIENFPLMFDDYDRFERIYYGVETTPPDEKSITDYLFPLTQPRGVPDKIPARLPYRYAVVMAQIQELIDDHVVEGKCNEMIRRVTPRSDVEHVDIATLKDKLEKASHWVERYAPEQYKFHVSKNLPADIKGKLTIEDQNAIRRVKAIIETGKYNDEQDLQNAIFSLAKDELNIKPARLFQVLYQVFLGTKSGPRLGPFLLALDSKFVIARLDEATSA